VLGGEVMHIRDDFVADGAERHTAAILPEIEAAVRAEFAQELAQASFLKRIRVHFLIRREIRRRLDEAVSPKSLY
jgi:hypothetical protein